MSGYDTTYVAVMDLVEDGVETLDGAARAALLALELDPGPLAAETLAIVPDARGEITGFLVVRGMLLSDVQMGGRTASQLLGPGDMLPRPGIDDSALAVERRLTVRQAATLAVLDDRLNAVRQRWPWLVDRLMQSTLNQLDRAATQHAISQLSRVEMRLLALMIHLGSRWGRVSTDGIVVDLDLTHATIGQLVGARRPTVSLAVKWLDAAGLLTRRADGAWVIAHHAAEQFAAQTVHPPRVRTLLFDGAAAAS